MQGGVERVGRSGLEKVEDLGEVCEKEWRRRKIKTPTCPCRDPQCRSWGRSCGITRKTSRM